MQVRPGDSRRVADPAERARQAEAGYRTTAERIARAHPAPGRMSSRQRLGMVTDMWAGAVARLEHLEPPRRLSCCLIYTLPGCHECAGCPRTSR